MTRIRRSPDESLGKCRWEESGERCKGPDRAHGFCPTHYARARYSKDLEYLLPEEGRAERCWVKNCGRPANSRGLCRAHYVYVGHHDIGTVDGINSRRTAEAKRKKDAVRINGQRLRVIKAMSGSTLENIGSAAGRSREWARQVMGGIVGYTEISAARAVAEYFGVPLAWLTDPAPVTVRDLGIQSMPPPGEDA